MMTNFPFKITNCEKKKLNLKTKKKVMKINLFMRGGVFLPPHTTLKTIIQDKRCDAIFVIKLQEFTSNLVIDLE